MNRFHFIQFAFLFLFLGVIVTGWSQKLFFEQDQIQSLGISHPQQFVLDMHQTFKIVQINQYWDLKSEDQREKELIHARKDLIEAIQNVLTPQQKELAKKLNNTAPSSPELRAYRRSVAAAKAEYHKKHIHPVNDERRNALDIFIDKDDQQFIEEVRYQLATNMALHRGEKVITPQRTYHKAMHQGHYLVAPDDLKKLENLAIKYSPDIEFVLSAINADHDQWTADLEQIEEQLRPAHVEFPKSAQFNLIRNYVYHALNIHFTPQARFLLLDPGLNEEIPSDDIEFARILSASPNPATDFQQLNLDITLNGPVEIDLINLNGQRLQRVYQGQLNKGTHLINVQIERLQPGMYMYRIKDSAGASTLPVIIQ